jgi:ABC-2 type transport system ATP-binding protein
VSDVVILVRGLRKSYGDFEAVHGIDLEVKRGEVFAFLGPNGAGKTTTVEILEGYRKRSAGEVSVLGEDPARAPRAWRGRIGIVLQDNKLDQYLTVRESLELYAGYYASPRPVDEVIDLVGLADKAEERTKKLSGGQQRRLDVALGIIGRPELLFLDEPTTGFDPKARREFWDVVRDLAAAGTTILLTTHYLDEAEALADRVGVIVRGRLIEVATPANLGGRNTATATVGWLDPDGPKRVATATPTRLVCELSERLGGEVPELVVSRPTLEDIYLSMIEEKP